MKIAGKLTISAREIGPAIGYSLKVKSLQDENEFVIPLHFTGATKWLKSDVIPLNSWGKKSLNKKYVPEKDRKSIKINENWQTIWFLENALEIEPYFEGKSGILYLKHFLLSPDERKVRIGVPTNQFMRLWVNGKCVHQTKKQVPLRPNYSGDGSNYANVNLKKGWNIILIKFLRGSKPIQAHFTLALANGHHGIADINQSRFP
jgi:hypothetical protein